MFSLCSISVKISRTVVTPNLPCHKGFMYSVFGRRSTSHCFTPTPIMAQETIAPAVVSALAHVASFGRAVPLSLSLLSGLCCRWP